ncbi:NAD(P)-dependent oxidoreductase [Nigerium massiliense]|uniref:NAD(P)-dependent oxidoreductase n=1 Tax=Nigerium massiliense TaxID=1522317 RepID=UPI00058CF24E|nr:NAD(P)-dependent oxidoreductase [Nigerium massiliense]
MKLLVIANAPLTLDPPDDVEVVELDPTQPIPAEHLDAEGALVEGWGSPTLKQLAEDAPYLTWVQTLAAGPDAVLRAGFGPQVTICTGRGFHDKTVSEHALALTLTALTDIPTLLERQRDHDFAHEEFGSWRPLHSPDRLSTLIESNVLIWGFGSIGQHMATLFAACSANVRGVATSRGERGGFEVFTEDDLPQLLPETDVLVMVLPSSDGTEKALNAERIAMLKPISWVVNVGRGTTVDEDALVEALNAGRLGGAALDVTYEEPYPSDGPLWDARNVVITPHMAGGRAVGADEMVNRQIEHLRRGEPLENAVER